MSINVHMVSLGCARNDVDSEELAGRLAHDGFELVDQADDADVIVVNTCGFIEQAKKDSIDTLLNAAQYKDGRAQAVVAVGCMAQRYGAELADAMPEADAVLGFDSYPQIASKLRRILDGEQLESHVPTDRRTLLPIAPVDRQRSTAPVPGHQDAILADIAPASGPPVMRSRLGDGPFAPLKIASGCDRRCAFCAIPSFRGAHISRPMDDILAEARWLADHGVREVMLVSENTSSYGKDLSNPEALPQLLHQLSEVEGLEWIRVSYLQPAEIRPSMLSAIAETDKVVPYFDLSFQHASGPLLKRMRRHGDAENFLALIDRIRQLSPAAGIRTNMIIGFPGETEQDIATLIDFLNRARLDVVGLFAYSDEEGTEGATLDAHLGLDTIHRRLDRVSSLVEELCNQRAEQRIGSEVEILVEEIGDATIGRSAHQAPEVDGCSLLPKVDGIAVGDIVPATVVGVNGVDLICEPVQGRSVA